MFKAYRKDVELVTHGAEMDCAGVVWARQKGVVRVEIELKKRLLSELNLTSIDDITQERLEDVYREQTEILRRVDRSDDPDILASLPGRVRITAAAWMAGQDISSMMNRATLYRHAKILREYGLDIMQARNVCNFPVKVRVVELEPLSMPEWYSLNVVNR